MGCSSSTSLPTGGSISPFESKIWLAQTTADAALGARWQLIRARGNDGTPTHPTAI